MKVCSKCNENKKLDEFYINSKGALGKASQCKKCKSTYGASRYQNNKEKILKSCKEYRDNNKEKRKATVKSYCQNNKEKISAYGYKWRSINKEKISKRMKLYDEINKEKKSIRYKQYAKNNPEVKIRSEAKRRAIKRLSSGKLSIGIKDKLYALQKGKCPCCKLPLGDNYHLDHIMPLALGGSNTDDNVQLLRAKCNQQKGSVHPTDFMQSRGFLF